MRGILFGRLCVFAGEKEGVVKKRSPPDGQGPGVKRIKTLDAKKKITKDWRKVGKKVSKDWRKVGAMKIIIIKKICQIFRECDFMQRWGHLLQGTDILRNIIMAGENCKLQFHYRPRSKGPGGGSVKNGIATIDIEKPMDGDDLHNFATTVKNQSFVQRVAGSSNKKIELKRSRKGGQVYNNREYAKHFARAMQFKESTNLCLFCTVTAPTGFWEDGKEITVRQFFDRARRSLKIACGREKAWQICSFQPQENGHPHAHFLLFTRDGKGSYDWRMRVANLFRWAGSFDSRLVKPEDFKQTFDYLHYYTKYSAEMYLEAEKSQDIPALEKAGKALKMVAWAENNGIPNFIQSGGRNLEPVEEKKTVMPCGMESAKTQNDTKNRGRLEELEKILDNFIAKGEKEVPPDVARAVVEILDTLFPCIKGSIERNGKCQCLLRDVYVHAKRIAIEDGSEKVLDSLLSS